MKLVDNWMRTHRKYSAQAMGLAAAIVIAWEKLPDDLKTALPKSAPSIVAYTVATMLVLGIFGSMVDQGAITDPKPKDPKP